MRLTAPSILAAVMVLIDSTIVAAGEARLLRRQYHIADTSFCIAGACVDFDGDGQRELLFASRLTKQIQLLHATDGAVVWSKRLDGDQQSIAAHDLDGDGDLEILYTVSDPGRLYVLDRAGKVTMQWDSGDWKLGNSAVIVDADGDGVLDGFLGSRSKYLVRLNMQDLTVIERRSGWIQCGCHTTAMDVDGDGRWDMFAGSGDDSGADGVLQRFDPVTLKTVWSYPVGDNGSSADAVLVDIDGDGEVEVLKSVDDYARDGGDNAIYAFETDGELLWKRSGIAGEDSPNAADLDGDGEIEIIGMTFGCEVYSLDARGRIRWRRDLRPELSDGDAHAYLTPILCDLNGDRRLEIVALTNGGYFDAKGTVAGGQKAANGIVFALSPDGEILERIDVGGRRYWGDAFVSNVDDDPFLEVVIAGSGGLDVIETRGLGPDSEHFQRRRGYQRLNVVPWAYEDSYFIYRGRREGVVNLTDNLVLAKNGGAHRTRGSFTTRLLTLPPARFFDEITYTTRTPPGTGIRLDILDDSGAPIETSVPARAQLAIAQPVRLRFLLSTTDSTVTPVLDAYRLSFEGPRRNEN